MRPPAAAAALSAEAEAAALRRQARLTKPPGSLGALERIAVQLAGIQGRERPRSRPAAALIFAADHPVCRHGVSAYPASVTAAMLANFARGGAAASVLARRLAVPLRVIDVGVDPPVALPPPSECVFPVYRDSVASLGAGDLRREDAMSPEVFAAALAAGRRAVEALAPETQVLIAGEMGIGNTTAAAAVAARLLGGDPDRVVGPGTGLDGDALARKREVVRDALKRTEPWDPGASDAAAEALRRLGGRDLAALAGALIAARERGLAVVVDGFIASSAALAACAMQPGLRGHLLFGHRSAEPGHSLVLEALGAEPLLDLGLRLGEASGALTAFPLVDLACALHAGMATFEEARVPDRAPERPL